MTRMVKEEFLELFGAEFFAECVLEARQVSVKAAPDAIKEEMHARDEHNTPVDLILAVAIKRWKG